MKHVDFRRFALDLISAGTRYAAGEDNAFFLRPAVLFSLWYTVMSFNVGKKTRKVLRLVQMGCEPKQGCLKEAILF